MFSAHRATALVLSLAVPASAAPAQGSCLAPAEAQALLTSFLPDIIRSLADTCRPSLPADAFLVRSGGALADRYAPEARTAWRTGRIAAAKIAGDDDLFRKLDDETARKVFAAGVSGEIAKDVKAKDCATVDRVLYALEPLPPANMSMLIGTLMEAVGRDNKPGKGKFPICPPESSRK